LAVAAFGATAEVSGAEAAAVAGETGSTQRVHRVGQERAGVCPPGAEQELAALKQQADYFQDALEQTKQRMTELEQESKK